MTGPLPNFLVIGATRAGSTALHHYLQPHPEVFLASRKEIRYFNVNFDHGLDWYREHFAGVVGERAIGEATPSYLYRADAIERIATVLPEVRLIALLRHPVERAYSHYWMNRRMGREDRSFDRAVADEEATPSPAPTSGGEGTVAPYHYLGPGHYLSQLQFVGRHFRRDQLLMVLFDDLRQSPGSTYGSVCRFLDVDDSFVPANLGQPLNVATDFRSLALRRVSRSFRGRAKPIGRVLGKLNQRAVENPVLDPVLRHRLVEHYRPDNAALAAWLGRDLSAWDR